MEAIITSLRHQGAVTRKIILVGRPQDTEKGELILRLVSKKEFEILGHVDLSSPEGRDRWPETLDRIYNQGVGEVFVCSWQAIEDPMQLYWSLKTSGILLRILPIGLEIPHQNPRIEIIGGMPTIVFSPPASVTSYQLPVTSLLPDPACSRLQRPHSLRKLDRRSPCRTDKMVIWASILQASNGVL